MENIRRARCSRVVLSELLAARKANFLSLLVSARKKMAVLTCSQRPFVTPLLGDRFSYSYFPFNRRSENRAQVT